MIKIKKISSLSITLLLLLSSVVVVASAESISLEEGDAGPGEDVKERGRENEGPEKDTELLEGSTTEPGLGEELEDELSRKRYEEGVENDLVPNNESDPGYHTRRTDVGRENIPKNIYSSEEDYQTRDTLRIDGDMEFAGKAVEEGWEGDGSEEDPYIIENYEIDGGEHGYSIYIGNVTDYFEVRNCRLHNASGEGGEYFRNSGLHLFNTTNGSIRKNLVLDNMQMGIYLERTKDSFVEENKVLSNGGHGILLEHSSENEVEDNIVGEENGYEEKIGGERTRSDVSREREGERERDGDKGYHPNTLLVQVDVPDRLESRENKRVLQDRIDSLTESVRGEASRIYTPFNTAEIRLEEGVGVESAVDILSERDDVVNAEPNYLWEAENVPNDPGYDSLWAMPRIDAPGAWDVTTGSEDVVVAVVDTGIDHTHPDLKGNMWTSDEGHHGYNALNDSYHPMDDNGHGTHVAGTIGAVGDNDKGVVGMNWNVSLMGLKFLDSDGTGTTSDAIACLEYVLERKKEGENVVATSNSWSGLARSEILYRAIEKHQEKGISFIAAAGNDGRDNDLHPTYPANYDLSNVISVAATDRNDELAQFSNYGERTVDVGAPGVDINSTYLDDDYEYMSGTSMAVPHVSGMTALLASQNSSYDQVNFKNAILSTVSTSRDLRGRTLSGGRINASRAVTASPSPEDIQFWIHRPGSPVVRGDRTPVIVSLNDGVDPLVGADVSADLSTREETIPLEDEGGDMDRMEGDGYYSNAWTPRFVGDVTLTITARSDEQDWEETKEITVEVGGGAGIYLEESDKNRFDGNTVFNEEHGILLHSSGENRLLNNELLDNDETGLHLYDSDENHIENQTLEDGENGVLLDRSHDNFFSKNTISDSEKGIALELSKENVIDENTLSANGHAIYLENSETNSITNNIFSHNSYGIHLYTSGDNYLAHNSLSKNQIGIYLRYSTSAVLENNQMEEDGVFISSHRLEDWTSHIIDTTNTVNGKPIYYWEGEEGGTVPEGAGQVILADCTGVTVEGQNLSHGNGGVLVGHSEGNRLANIVASDHEAVGGINLYWSTDNDLIDNTASSNTYGIYSFASQENEFKRNNVSHNENGIYLEDSPHNVVTDNTVTYNDGNGIWIDDSIHNEISGNHVYNNEFRGIDLYRADDSILTDNFLFDHSIGVDIARSVAVSISNNRMEDDGIYMWGDRLEHWDSHTIDLTNSVNGRPVYYWKNETGRRIPDGAGQVILVDCEDIVVEDQNVSYGTAGILLGFSEGNTVINNDASNNDKGMRLYESDDNEIRENNVSDNTNEWSTLSYGIWLSSSTGNSLIGNEARDNCGDGIYISDSNDNRLVDNDVSNNAWRGIDLSRSDATTIVDSDAFGNRLGIRLQNSHSITIEENEVQKGIELQDSEDVVLVKNTMTEEGISIWGSRKSHWNSHDIDTGNTLKGRTIYYWSDRTGGEIPEEAGQVILANCTDVVIRDQSVKSGRLGIQLGFSSGNTIEENALSNHDYGMYLRNSDDNTVSNNMISDNTYGLYMYDSHENSLTSNNASENELSGIDLWFSDNNTLDHNTIWNNRRRGIRLWGSIENTLVQNEGTKNSYGMTLSGSHENLLEENELAKNRDGIYLSDSAENTITGNTVDRNSDSGIEMEDSETNLISDNTMLNNSYAVSLDASDNNTFVANNVSNNDMYGFHLLGSFENSIYHNRFLKNEDQAFDDGDNSWDGGDPEENGRGGNYWSDDKSQDRGDGIGDQPYDIPGNENKDEYPWVEFQMKHPVGDFETTVEDITAGEEPVVEITHLEDVHGGSIEGNGIEVEILFENRRIDEELYLESDESGGDGGEEGEGEGEAETKAEVEYVLWEVTDAGEYEVEVVIDEVARTDNFSVETAGLDHIKIEPRGRTISAGEPMTFKALAYDVFDNVIEDVTEDTNWSIEDEAGGNWTDNRYRSQFAGTWIVTGTYEEWSKDRVDLTVEPGPVDHVEIDPRQDQVITAGEKIYFSAEAYDRYGNLITDEEADFTWENTDPRGRFERTKAGEYEVTAAYDDTSSEPTTVVVEEAEDRSLFFAIYWLLTAVLILISIFIYQKRRKKKGGEKRENGKKREGKKRKGKKRKGKKRKGKKRKGKKRKNGKSGKEKNGKGSGKEKNGKGSGKEKNGKGSGKEKNGKGNDQV